MLFNKQKPVNNLQAERDYEHEITKLQHEHRLKVAEIENAHKLAMKEKEFELKHFKDEEIQKLRESVANKDTEIEVLKKENEMLAKITNLNADLIDIKDLVSKLIGKLPEINLSSLTINGSNK